MKRRGCEPRAGGPVRTGMDANSAQRPLARLAAASVLTLLITGCASLAPEPTGSNALAGHWALDRAASGDFDAAVAHMLAQRQKKLHNRRRAEFGADGAEIASGRQDVPGFPPVPDEAPERVRARLDESLRPPSRLVIKLGTGAVSFVADGEPARRFYPGQRVGRIDVEGTARQDAGWAGTVFVVQQKYLSGATREQRFTAHGDELVVTLAYKDPDSGQFALRSVYRRQ
jgi:hypothetical protein